MSTSDNVTSVAEAAAELDDKDLAADLTRNAESAEERRADWLNGVRDDGVPHRFRDALPGNPVTRRWVSHVFRSSVRDAAGFTATIGRGDGLLIRGPLGTGKTHEAIGAARALVLGGLAGHVRIITTADYYGLISPGGEGETAFRRLATAALLVLDDLGAARNTPWTEEQDYRLIDARYRAGLRTIVTSNYGRLGEQPKSADGKPKGPPVPSFTERVGERIASRTSAMCVTVPMTGPDRRRSAA